MCISIGNHMISSTIWIKYARVNFFKLTKLHEPVSAYLLQIAFLLHENVLDFSQSEALKFFFIHY